MTAPKRSQKNPQGRSRAEWISLSISLLVLSTIVGLILSLWFKEGQQSQPHLLITSAKSVRQQDGQFYVPFSVTNKGDRTAESVQVTAELTIRQSMVATGEQEFEFVSSGEVRKGAFVFDRDPSQGDVTIRVASYKLP
ncbi:MAG: TIGR02588 family protein [Elainellaceae cyanobacterium]